MNWIAKGVLSVFLLVFLAFGGKIIVPAVQDWWQAQQVLQWPTAQGRFIERQLDVTPDSESGNIYRVRVRYAYEVAGQRHESDRLAYGYVATNQKGPQQRIYDKLMRGDHVQVRYSPAHPEEAVLATGSNSGIVSSLVFGTTWILFTIGFGVMCFMMINGDQRLLDSIEVS